MTEKTTKTEKKETKEVAKKTAAPKKALKSSASGKAGVYFEAVGRRKNAIARVRLFQEGKKGTAVVNDKDIAEYLPVKELQESAFSPLNTADLKKEFFVSAKTYGGGVRGQAEAIRLGVARALLKYKPELRQILKAEGFLTRDPRAKERRKFGLKKARKAAQWSKR